MPSLEELLLRIEALEARVAELEGGGPPRGHRPAPPTPGETAWRCLALDLSRNAALIEACGESSFRDAVAELFGVLPERSRPTSGRLRTRSEGQLGRSVDLNDPRSAGWTWMAARGDPMLDGYGRALARLAEHRGMRGQPILWDPDDPRSVDQWLEDELGGDLESEERPPHFVMMVGGPDRLPFHLQAALTGRASVGRIDLPELAALQAWADKVVDAETSAPRARREALLFATDDGPGSATGAVRSLIAQPFAEAVTGRFGYALRALTAGEAHKDALLEALHDARPALTLITGHGAAWRRGPLEERKARYGAVVCAGGRFGEAPPSVAAADLPADGPLLPGGVLFHLACFSAGTPQLSEYAPWMPSDVPRHLAQADFTAALPQALLARPDGPLAVVGHLDLTWVRDIGDVERPEDRQRARPVHHALAGILEGLPVGRAVTPLHLRFHEANYTITRALQLAQQAGGLTEGAAEQLVNQWVRRNDARNFLILGDPGCRVRAGGA